MSLALATRVPGGSEPDAKRRPHETGFTLLEVLIAVSILAIALLPLMSAQTMCLKNSGSAQKLTTATLVARKEMSRILLGGFPEVGEEEGDFGNDAPDYKWKREVKAPPEPLPPELVREIDLTVIWSEGGLERSYELTSYAANPATL